MKSFLTLSLLVVCTLASTAFAGGGACDPDKLKEKNQTYQECSDEFYKNLSPSDRIARTDVISKVDVDSLPGKYFANFKFDKATEKRFEALKKQIAKRFGMKNQTIHLKLSKNSPIRVNSSDYLVSQFVEASWMSEYPLTASSKIEAYKEALSYKGQTAILQVTASVFCSGGAFYQSQDNICTPEMLAVNNGEVYEVPVKVQSTEMIKFIVDHWWVNEQALLTGINNLDLQRERGDQYICANAWEQKKYHCNEKNLNQIIKAGK